MIVKKECIKAGGKLNMGNKQPMIVVCPYRTDTGRCVHCGGNTRCGFKNKEKECRSYNEWLETRSVTTDA